MAEKKKIKLRFRKHAAAAGVSPEEFQSGMSGPRQRVRNRERQQGERISDARAEQQRELAMRYRNARRAQRNDTTRANPPRRMLDGQGRFARARGAIDFSQPGIPVGNRNNPSAF